MNRIRVAVAGAGRWGRNLARCFHELGALESIVTRTPDRMTDAARDYSVPQLSFDAAIGSDAIDAIVIATPPETHADLCIRAVEAGKHVLIEKPLALDWRDCERVQAAVKQSRKIVMVGHQLQFHPVFARLRQMVLDGHLGTIFDVESRRLSPGRLRSAEDVASSFAPHDISMILSLFGEPPRRSVKSCHAHLMKGHADDCRFDLEFKEGATAHVQVSWLSPFKAQTLVVRGSEKMAVFDDRAQWGQKLAIYDYTVEDNGGGDELIMGELVFHAVEKSEPLLSECSHFLECAASGRTPMTDISEAMAVMKVVLGVDTPVST